MLTSKEEIVKLEIDWNKPTIVKNFNTDLILIVVQNEDENEINFENRNNLFSGIVINPGNTNYKIGKLLIQQKRIQYYYYKEKIILQNEKF